MTNMNGDTLLKNIFNYVKELRNENKSLTVVEAITNYCFKNDLEVEFVGSLIAQTPWFKNFVQGDCVLNESENKIEEW